MLPSLRLPLAAIAAACAAASLGGAHRAPPDPGLRRVGLWEQHVTIDDGAYAIPASQICLDAATAQKLTVVGAQMDRALCRTYALMRRGPGRWSFRSVCDLADGASVTTVGVVTGDFQTRFVVKATGVTTGSPNARTNGSHAVAVDAAWRGTCPAGMSGGDMTVGGRTINLFAPPTP